MKSHTHLPASRTGHPCLGPSAALRAILRVMIAISMFLCSWIGAESDAWAKSPMCGDAAESIAAPPPFMAARGSGTISNCGTASDLTAGVVSRGSPEPSFAADQEPVHQHALLTPPLIVEASSGSSSRLWSELVSAPQSEHRWNQSRPPSSV